MIKSVTITNYLGFSLKLDLGGLDKSGLLITDMEGISGGKADIVFSDLASGDGGVFNSARAPFRPITMMLRLLDYPISVEASRALTYKLFPLKKPVVLTFETDEKTCYIEGYVESNDPPIFTNKAEAQISIKCANPYFYSLYTYVETFYGVIPEFEFPFENPSLDDDLIEFGDIQNKTEGVLVYEGQEEVGIELHIYATGVAVNPIIYNTTTNEIFKIDTAKLQTLTGSGIKNGDEIIVSTVVGRKSVKLLRDGTFTNILNCLDKDVDWIHIVPGDNVFYYTAEEGLNYLQFKVLYNVLYLGV